MVRIIPEENQTPKTSRPQPKSQELDYRHRIFLNMLGLVVAEAPEKAQQLLGDYSIELSRESPEEEIADALVLAIGECDDDFNGDLASLILDTTLSSSYDAYDFKQLAGQPADSLSNAGSKQNAEGKNRPGILGGLVSTIGQIGGILSKGIHAIQSRSASEQTRQGINTYRKQKAEQREADAEKKNSLTLFFLLAALGIGILGFVTYIKRQAQPNIKTS